ncbi:MAG TPA: glycerol-3-phosphate 1-O-acyltransferase PlsY [Chloroflexota bacterium]|jgi:glycerol-3-phosphate acyltransferase PlsY|nr:glycerol-3-phosphate 1-O-acyltransferase PlsY [Chloroflexota bacterium]
MSAWPQLVVALVAGYLIGAVPVGYLVGRSQGKDPRSSGSGKMGATNVLRSLGPKASALVLLGDIAKGAAAVAIAHVLLPDVNWAEAAAGLAAIIGHVFPVYVGFRGGRGVATALGAMFVMNPIVGTAALVTGALVIYRSRLASLGSLMGALAGLLVIAALYLGRPDLLAPLVYCALAALIIAVTHRDNIQRLADGTERKIQL